MRHLAAFLLLFNILWAKSGSEAGASSWVAQNGITVLCYHQIVPAKQVNAGNPFIVSLESFKQQISWLKAQGFQTISTQTFLQYIENKKPNLPAKPIVITFDDGVDGLKNFAAKVLSEAGYKAAIFVIPAMVGKKKFLTYKDLKQLKKAGHEIYSHSFNHPHLSRLKYQKQNWQVKEAHDALKKNLAVSPNVFAYPFGSFNKDSQSALQRNGYRAGFTVFPGSNYAGDNRFLLTRYVVMGEHSLLDFQSRVDVRGLKLRSVQPKPGSFIKNNQLIRIQIAPGLDKSRLSLSFGRKFIGLNPPIKYHYNGKTGELAFRARFHGGQHAVALVQYLHEGFLYQNSAMFVTQPW